MKKFILLFISLAMFTACSKDDESPETDDGSEIVGTWFLVDAKAGGVSGNLSDCTKNTFVTFNANGTASSEYYEESDGNCEVSDSNTGNWDYKGNSIYSVDIAGYDNLEGTVNFESSTRFSFTSPEISPVVLIFEK